MITTVFAFSGLSIGALIFISGAVGALWPQMSHEWQQAVKDRLWCIHMALVVAVLVLTDIFGWGSGR